MKYSFKLPLVVILIGITLVGCSSLHITKMPMVAVDKIQPKSTELSDDQLKNWSYLDLVQDTVPGMSVNKAYDEIIKNKKGKTTIVAVIDSGIDIDHEDLENVIWTNQDEIPNNGKDDDNNGYIDDVHGWNFLGDGYNEQLEFVRLLASGDESNPRFTEAQSEYNEEIEKYTSLKTQTDQFYQVLNMADEGVSKYLNKTDYTKEDLEAIETDDPILAQSVGIVKYVLLGIGFDKVADAKKEIKKDQTYINDRLDFNLNKTFMGRATNDNIDDLLDTNYGNNNVKPIGEDEDHGTHVAGIIAAERDNGKGIDGIANNVKIMPIRTVPNGDEYDKDVALAIRYAADNGAKVINMSFGKYYSPHSDWVREAIVYAAKKDVLLVAGAGNEGFDLDQKTSYPNDQVNNGPEVSDNYLAVGAIDSKYGPDMVASYSNYGKINVDVFAPGSDIYSSVPYNNYEFFDGTSMASPAVAGIAALIRSLYPALSASQVKHIIMDSGLLLNSKVEAGDSPYDNRPFNELSKSGKIVNLYNALIMASRVLDL